MPRDMADSAFVTSTCDVEERSFVTLLGPRLTVQLLPVFLYGQSSTKPSRHLSVGYTGVLNGHVIPTYQLSDSALSQQR